MADNSTNADASATANRRLRHALILLSPILLLAMVLAATVDFRGAISVDNRHYVEMATGFRAHGMPYTLNAYSEDFPEARPAFNIPKDGKLWGAYPPFYPMVASLALRVGGLAGISRQNFLIVACLAFGVFLLGYRLSKDPMRGVVAAYLLVFMTPVWASSTESLAQPLTLLCLVFVPLLQMLALDAEQERRLWSARGLNLASGLAAGLGLATHLIAAPMGLVALASIAFVRPKEASSTQSKTLRELLPTRAGLARIPLAFVGFVLPVLPIAFLNRIRFDSYNPISYGPCIWSHCALYESKALSAGAMVRFFLPAILFLAVTTAGIAIARHSVRHVLVVVAVAGVALCLPTPVRSGTWAMLRTVYGYLFDLTNIDFGTPWSYGTYPDGLGHIRGNKAIKSLFQSSPFLLSAVLAGYGFSGRKGRALLVLAPVLGLCVSLSLFARFKPPYTFGDPYVLLRYAIPATPFLSVLAADVLCRLPLRRWHVAGVIVTATVGALALALQATDASFATRYFLLRVTLILAFATVAATAWSSHDPSPKRMSAAALVATACLSCSAAVTWGSDTATLARVQISLDRDVAALARNTPNRFALVGYGPQTDHVLTLRAERDINYIDLLEGPSWDNFRVLIDLWADDNRPVYGIFPNDTEPPFRWPYADWDVRATLIDSRLNLWRISPPEPGRRLTREQVDGLRAKLAEDWRRRHVP
jgi:hypothetical protein